MYTNTVKYKLPFSEVMWIREYLRKGNDPILSSRVDNWKIQILFRSWPVLGKQTHGVGINTLMECAPGVATISYRWPRDAQYDKYLVCFGLLSCRVNHVRSLFPRKNNIERSYVYILMLSDLKCYILRKRTEEIK